MQPPLLCPLLHDPLPLRCGHHIWRPPEWRTNFLLAIVIDCSSVALRSAKELKEEGREGVVLLERRPLRPSPYRTPQLKLDAAAVTAHLFSVAQHLHLRSRNLIRILRRHLVRARFLVRVHAYAPRVSEVVTSHSTVRPCLFVGLQGIPMTEEKESPKEEHRTTEYENIYLVMISHLLDRW